MPAVGTKDGPPAAVSGRASCLAECARVLALIDACPDRAVFTRVYRERSLAEAARLDGLPASDRGPLWGAVISLKDLFDVAGDVTTAGSPALEGGAAAARDAEIVLRLREAGALVVGRTAMSELAYSGLGLNPRFGSPENVLDSGRVPGGSSSGAAACVARGLCDAAIGTDTGGSIRVPAAFNGIVGFKPTQARISRKGTFGLSETQDTVGPLASNVEMCALADAVMVGLDPRGHVALPLSGVRIAVPGAYLLDDLDPAVSAAYERTLRSMEAAGARLVETGFPEGAMVAEMLGLGGLVGPEAYRAHQHLLRLSGLMDPFVVGQMQRFAEHPAANYTKALALRRKAQASFSRTMADVDVLACPTVAVPAPRLDELAGMDAMLAANRRVLRNTSPFNTLDVPAVSLPCHRQGEVAVGVMLVGKAMEDRRLLGIAAGAEAALGSGMPASV